MAAIMGWAFLDEEFGAARLVGSTLALAGVLLIALTG
jgi:drug/metabolite transporter (DMT)-like permease